MYSYYCYLPISVADDRINNVSLHVTITVTVIHMYLVDERPMCVILLLWCVYRYCIYFLSKY